MYTHAATNDMELTENPSYGNLSQPEGTIMLQLSWQKQYPHAHRHAAAQPQLQPIATDAQYQTVTYDLMEENPAYQITPTNSILHIVHFI